MLATRAARLTRAMLCGAVLCAAAPLAAQVRDTTAAADTAIDYASLPRDVAREVRDVAEGATTLHLRGDSVIAAGRVVNADVLVRDGSLTVGGTVAGRIVAVDADVVFEPGASVGGDVLVVRGTVRGADEADIGGSVRAYAGGLRGLADVVRGGAAEDWRWIRRLRDRGRRSGSEITVTTGRTYNRVEGLPLYAGPTLRQRVGPTLTTVRAYGVLRTAHGLSLTSQGAGHLATAEVRLGGTRGVTLAGRSFDVVDAVEGWQLAASEVGLASFFLHRDYRDYFVRHGADARATFFAGPDADFTLSYGDERWSSAATRDPLSLVRNAQRWRDNPRFDEGRFHIATAAARFDTRNSPANPWAGWYLVADYEHGAGSVDATAPTSAAPIPSGRRGVEYGRGFLDLRRYNRLAREAQLNLRLVAGGWLHGDPLPLQRRLSIGGPGTIPGFDFRRATGGTDVQQCSAAPDRAPPGRPAECDRVALAQVEYRGRLGLNIDPFAAIGVRPAGAAAERGRETQPSRFRGQFKNEWVVFFDAGRGWQVGERAGELRYGRGEFPALRTFRSDVGLGLLFGSAVGLDQLGIYVAKAVSDADEPANVFVRLRYRF